MSPTRIQRKRTKGWRMPEGAVYVGRPSRWGNNVRATDCEPCNIGEPMPHEHLPYGVQGVIDLYADMAYSQPSRDYEPLRGRDLACWCPEECGELVPAAFNSGGWADPCTKPKGHAGRHDPDAPPYCHADVLLELANR